MTNYFIYARKSTDVEDKQVRSIEDQLAELREFARRDGLKIKEELVEKQSAKIPGRPIFDRMIKRLEKGEAGGILSWHPDRLARNSVDGGKIIYLVDTGKIQSLKFVTHWFEPTPQGKFMLNIAFGQSKYYVDSLSENTKRGLYQKVKRGEYPSLAPIGYINNPRTKLVEVNPEKAKIITEAFERYAEGDMRLEDMANFFAERGILSTGGKLFHKSKIHFLLANPFYCGLFKYAKEIYEGKHQPIVSKKTFDRVQQVLKDRAKPRSHPTNNPRAFCGLLRCGYCGMGISGEKKTKYQKNGNTHHYTYYRCTRKSKTIKCSEVAVREEKLDSQISTLLKQFSLKEDWTKKLLAMLDTDRLEAVQSSTAFSQAAKEKVKRISAKLQLLLDSYLDQTIERDIYLKKKAQMLSEKKTLEEKISDVEKKQTGWLEPAEEWIKEAENLPTIANGEDLFLKKVAAKKIFGSNLILSNRKVRLKPEKVPQLQWAALAAANSQVGKIESSYILVPSPGIGPGSNP